MARYALIDGYLDSMRSSIRWRRDLDDLVAEMEDHLYSTTEQMLARGTDVVDAQRATLARFGDPKVLAAAYASNHRGGIAVPTTFTRRAGLLALIAGGFWLLAGVLENRTDRADDWEVYYLLFTIAVVVAGVLTVMAMIGLGKRAGGLGTVGMIGAAIASLGVLLSFVAWAGPLWMSLQGIGYLLIAIAVLRSDTIVPRIGVMLVASAFLIGPILFVILAESEVGWRDSYGDYPLAWIISGIVGYVLMAGGLFVTGRWLRSEEPVDVDATPVAA
ncbi:MAG: permease prefix domain 1-containing protein [Acidimicrobiia bacterium]